MSSSPKKMGFFSKAVLLISTGLSAKTAFTSLVATAKRADEAVEASECGRLAIDFMKGSEQLEAFMAKACIATEKLDSPAAARGLRASGSRAVAGMRMVSAYYLHVSRSEPLGDFVIEQGLDIERQWAATRPSLVGAGGAEGLSISMRKVCEGLALSGVAVALRAIAEREAAQGTLNPALAEDLASRARAAGDDAMSITQSKPKAISSPPTPKELAALDKSRLRQAGSMAGVSEQAQIYFLAGMRDKAEAAIRQALDKPLGDEREAALAGLAKEQRPARGNNPAFVAWSKQAFPAPQAPSARPRSA